MAVSMFETGTIAVMAACVSISCSSPFAVPGRAWQSLTLPARRRVIRRPCVPRAQSVSGLTDASRAQHRGVATRYEAQRALVRVEHEAPLARSCRPAGRAVWCRRLYSAAGHGRSEAKDIQVTPRQAARDAQALAPRAGRVPAVPPAEAAAPRLPDLRHVPRPRGRAARDPGS